MPPQGEEKPREPTPPPPPKPRESTPLPPPKYDLFERLVKDDHGAESVEPFKK